VLFRHRFILCAFSLVLGAALSLAFSSRPAPVSASQIESQISPAQQNRERIANALFREIAKSQMSRLPEPEPETFDDPLYAHVSSFISAKDFTRMPLRYRESLAFIATDPTPQTFAFCFAPDTDPAIVQAFESVRAARPRFQFSNRWTAVASGGAQA